MLLAPLCAVSLTACNKYHLHVEMDRMTGTAYPVAQTQGTKTYDIKSVYEKHWDKVIVNESNQNIAPLTGPFDPADPDQYDYITEDELDTLETAYRQAPIGDVSCGDKCRQYHVYGIIVDHYLEEATGYRSIHTIGQMWTEDSRAFVMYHKSGTIQNSPEKYLRSTLHEIGHAHNLHHQDGDGNETLMTKTGQLGPSFKYKFHSASKKHLVRHPGPCKFPGIATWT